MDLICLNVGQIETNCYLAYVPLDKGKGFEGLIIDPGDECEKILSVVSRYNLKIKEIVNTHGHVDHIKCNEILKMALGCEIWMSEEDSDLAADAEKNGGVLVGDKSVFVGTDRFLEDGEPISLGGKPVFRVISLPGHSPGGIGVVSVDNRYAMLGDLLFAEGYGRTDLYGGDASALKKSISKVLSKLPSDIMVLPGHGPVFKLFFWECFLRPGSGSMQSIARQTDLAHGQI